MFLIFFCLLVGLLLLWENLWLRYWKFCRCNWENLEILFPYLLLLTKYFSSTMILLVINCFHFLQFTNFHIQCNFSKVVKEFSHGGNIKPFSSNVPLLYPQKTSKNLWFSDVFRVYRCATLVENGLETPILTLYVPSPKNGQTHWNKSLAICRQIESVWPFCGVSA